MNQLYVYIYTLPPELPTHLGHHRALSSAPYAIQLVAPPTSFCYVQSDLAAHLFVKLVSTLPISLNPSC